jgi:S-adenosylmethionine:tRNA ribosyltransferase-isomerase
MSVDSLLGVYGQMPLPPYIASTETAQQKYQTVFAKHDGSVAAPTASLHFTSDLIMKLAQK